MALLEKEETMRSESGCRHFSLTRRVFPARLVVLVSVLVGLVVSSCALDDRVHDSSVDRAVAPVVAAHCPTTAKEVVDYPTPGIPSGAAPADFDARRVLQCSIVSSDAGNGKTSYEVTVSEGAFTPDLQEALRLPDQEFVRPGHAVCSADAIMLPMYLLSDGNGRAYRPQLPSTACSKPRPEVLEALDELFLSQTDSYRLSGPTPR